MLTCEVAKDRFGVPGWSINWKGGFVSAMPDEATARRCAAAGAMEEACKAIASTGGFTEGQYFYAVDLAIAKARAALSLAINGPGKGEGKGE